MADRSAFHITRGYGKCIEAMRRIDIELSWASTQKDPVRVQQLREDRAAWLELANVTPVFVGDTQGRKPMPEVAHG